MFCVLRVSIQNWMPSLSSIRESRHHSGCCLPRTVTFSAIPASLHASRTSANGFAPCNSAKHGSRYLSPSLMPCADHRSSVYRHGAAKRKSIVGLINWLDMSLSSLPVSLRERSQVLLQELFQI